MDSRFYNENIVREDLNKRVNIVANYEEAMNIIKKYEDVIKTNKKNIIFFAYQQSRVFRNFKENRKFKSLVEQFKKAKGTVTFQINIAKLVDKYPTMMTSSVALNILKSYYKDIKNICKENQEDFK